MSEVLGFEHRVQQVAQQAKRDDQGDPVERRHGRASRRSHSTMPPQVSTASTMIRPMNQTSIVGSSSALPLADHAKMLPRGSIKNPYK
jgi:hypothetical protein